MSRIQAFLRNTRGATSIEYAMIGVGVSIICLVGAHAIGTALSTQFLGPLTSGLN